MSTSSPPANQQFNVARFEELGHTGMIFLDRASADQYVVTNVHTHESKPMPPGQREVVHEETVDSFAFVRGESGDQIMEADGFLRQSVFRNVESGTLMLSWMDNHGKTIHRPLEEITTRFKSGEAKLDIEPTNACITVGLHFFHRARDLQARAYWELTGIYAALRLKVYNGIASKWYYNGMRSWKKELGNVFGLNNKCFVGSTHTAEGSTKEVQEPFDDRCLPSTSVNSMWLLWLMHRWAENRPRYGGFVQEESRSAARAIMRALLHAVVYSPSPWRLQVQLDHAWVALWPRPRLFDLAKPVVCFEVSSEGVVDVVPLQVLANTHPAS